MRLDPESPYIIEEIVDYLEDLTGRVEDLQWRLEDLEDRLRDLASTVDKLKELLGGGDGQGKGDSGKD